MGTDTQCLNYQIPGGMLSNLLSQLKSLNALDKFDEALKETRRPQGQGYPARHPTSQLVGLAGRAERPRGRALQEQSARR